jgi:poly(A) polymerase
MRLRADVGEVDEALADWWQTFSLADDLGREDLLAQLRNATTRPQRVARAPRAAPTDAPDVPLEPNASEDPDAPKKRRRRRRRRVDTDTPPSAAD